MTSISKDYPIDKNGHWVGASRFNAARHKLNNILVDTAILSSVALARFTPVLDNYATEIGAGLGAWGIQRIITSCKDHLSPWKHPKLPAFSVVNVIKAAIPLLLGLDVYSQGPFTNYFSRKDVLLTAWIIFSYCKSLNGNLRKYHDLKNPDYKFQVDDDSTRSVMETELRRFFGPSIFTLDKQDPRPKYLLLIADSDYNGAAALSADLISYYEELNKHYDLQIRVVKTTKDITDAILSASDYGKISNMELAAHGTEGLDGTGKLLSGAKLSKNLVEGDLFGYHTINAKTILDPDAIAKVDSDTTFTLTICNAGAGENSLAQHIAQLFGCRTIASPHGVLPRCKEEILQINPLIISLGSGTKEFTPNKLPVSIFKKLPSIQKIREKFQALNKTLENPNSKLKDYFHSGIELIKPVCSASLNPIIFSAVLEETVEGVLSFSKLL